MSNRRYTPEFKDEAVRQVVERGYRVAEVAERLGVSANNLHRWAKAVKPNKTDEQAAELNDAKKEILKVRDKLRRNQLGTVTSRLPLTSPVMRAGEALHANLAASPILSNEATSHRSRFNTVVP